MRASGCSGQRHLSICPQPNCVRLAKHHGMVRGLPRGLSLRCSRYAPPKRLSAPTRITGGDVHRGAVDFEAARYGSLQIRPRFPVSHPPPGNSTSITGGNLTSQIATPIWLIPSRFFADVTTCGSFTSLDEVGDGEIKELYSATYVLRQPYAERAMFMRVVEYPTLNVQDSAEPSE
ncbi:uncharacterized protein B0T23DRAFT_403951 [Neurospora hispaniola]|uniref:Uncharacterized protein n=1 Tax=Neurospora hispaniola TaxID=588809 RepID=A0AAJ0IAZ4_9PEZI|nr:hypothetical protein B0T23DRAFT_403951 [Neurospora hispaniola]